MLIEENIKLSAFTTLKVGGVARFFARIKNESDLKEAILFARNKNIPVITLGGGSNLLVNDDGFSGLVLKNEILGVSFEDNGGGVVAKVGSGENWDLFVSSSVEKGFCGIENLSGIPGSVGAGPVQNIGAYGSEIKDTVISVRTTNLENGEVKIFSNKECDFSYRHSFFKNPEGKKFFITSVIFKLGKNCKPNTSYKDLKEYFEKNGNNSPTTKEVREAVLLIRSRKMPSFEKFGTAGSFFKNPIISKEHFEKIKKDFPLLPGHDVGNDMVKVPLAWILDNVLSMKGYEKGNVGLYEKQPLVLFTKTSATAKEVLELTKLVEQKVFEKTGIKIEKEVQMIN